MVCLVGLCIAEYKVMGSSIMHRLFKMGQKVMIFTLSLLLCLNSSYANRGQVEAQRKRQVEVRRQYKSSVGKLYKTYFLAKLKNNIMSFRDFAQCFNDEYPEDLKVLCQSAEKYAIEKVIPAFEEMRIHLLMYNVAADPSVTDNKLTFWQRLWMYMDANDKPNHLFGNWTFLAWSKNLPELAELQNFTWDEIFKASSQYMDDWKSAELLYNVQYQRTWGKTVQEKLAGEYLSNERASDKRSAQLYNQMLLEKKFEEQSFVWKRMKAKKKEYKEAYLKNIQSVPEIAFLQLPTRDTYEEDEVVKNCNIKSYKEYTETVYKPNMEWGATQPNYQFHHNQDVKRLKDLYAHCKKYQSLQTNAFYKTPQEKFQAYKPMLRKAYNKMLLMQGEVMSDIYSLDTEHDPKALASLFGLGESVEKFRMQIQQERDEKLNKENDLSLGQNTEVDQGEVETDYQNKLRAIEDWTDEFKHIEFVDDMKFGLKVMAWAFVCYGAVTAIVGATGMEGGGWIAAAAVLRTAFCMFAPTLPIDYDFYNVAYDRYEMTFKQFFSTPGSMEVLQKVSQLEERDQDMFFQLVFSGLLTISPSAFRMIAKGPLGYLEGLVKWEAKR